MNTEKDLLKDMFHEIELKNPSIYFMENLMARVEKEVIKKQRKRQFFNFLGIAAGIIGIVVIPELVLSFLKIDISLNLNISNVFHGITIEPYYVIFSLIILFLLIGDTLLRKHFRIF